METVLKRHIYKIHIFVIDSQLYFLWHMANYSPTETTLLWTSCLCGKSKSFWIQRWDDTMPIKKFWFKIFNNKRLLFLKIAYLMWYLSALIPLELKATHCTWADGCYGWYWEIHSTWWLGCSLETQLILYWHILKRTFISIHENVTII